MEVEGSQPVSIEFEMNDSKEDQMDVVDEEMQEESEEEDEEPTTKKKNQKEKGVPLKSAKVTKQKNKSKFLKNVN